PTGEHDHGRAEGGRLEQSWRHRVVHEVALVRTQPGPRHLLEARTWMGLEILLHYFLHRPLEVPDAGSALCAQDGLCGTHEIQPTVTVDAIFLVHADVDSESVLGS